MLEGDINTASLFYKDKEISSVCCIMGEDYYDLWEFGLS
jgi:hypothetical protein